MAYKKPQVVAKSAAKQSFVAGCPEKTLFGGQKCCTMNSRCMVGSLK